MRGSAPARRLLTSSAMRISGNVLALVLCAACTGTIDSTPGDEETSDPAADPQMQIDPGDTTSAIEAATTSIPILRGTDRASAFSTHEARILKDNHFVRWTGVYIGGPCSGGSGWTRSVVSAIHSATGWQFMPIYVGQQASSICHAHRLTYRRGHRDGNAAVQHMKDFGWLPDRDIPVALDVEAATYFDNEAASTRYVRGWVNAVHKAGYRAYVYGSPFALAHFHDARVRIDGAWAASFFFHHFEKVRPGELDQMGSRFRHHNRAWQYAGDFAVSGAGKVDASTSHLLLAPRPGGSNHPAIMHRNVPGSCGGLEVGEGLARGESVAACDGASVLALSTTGELSLTVGGKTTWTAGTEGTGSLAVFEDTGELVVLDASGERVFATDSAGFPEAKLSLDGEGMTIADDTGYVWSDTDGTLVDDALVDLSNEDDDDGGSTFSAE